MESTKIKLYVGSPSFNSNNISVIKFAECITHRKIDEMAENFDAINSRSHLAANYSSKGCEKQIEGYEMDFDLVPRSVRRDRKMKGLINK
ncbi:Hypothetical predicted protein [Olea europaea subsp. europaea]|uniref:Uncharacterized protein n=1 Tax=Olea europaea subsp. europaea TaxID=158383 RepID=A0A8S0T119_OLEEU|nr:Hypothetical predicted protein [Olea europaea subsp. europaea]